MSLQDSTTKKEWPTTKEIDKVIAGLRAIRAIGDLLTAAADSVGQNRTEFHKSTLAEIGAHLEDLTTEALVILKWENPRPQAPSPEVFKLDPVTRGNLVKDMGKLAGMSPELQLMAEGICNDLELPLPEVIQERIAREKAARQESA
jgi:hypothetical protein